MKKPRASDPKRKPRKGVTLIEILLVISIILALGTSVSAFGAGFLSRNRLRNATNNLVSNLRIAQLNSISSREASTWGVEVTPTDIRLFATGNPAIDQFTKIPPGVSVSVGTVVFDNLTGNPDTPAAFTISGSAGGGTITVNEVGIVDVN